MNHSQKGPMPASKAPSRADAVLALIGNTPCVPLHFQPEGLRVWAKCEFLNPSGSVKDRFAARVVATGSGAAAATKMP